MRLTLPATWFRRRWTSFLAWHRLSLTSFLAMTATRRYRCLVSFFFPCLTVDAGVEGAVDPSSSRADEGRSPHFQAPQEPLFLRRASVCLSHGLQGQSLLPAQRRLEVGRGGQRTRYARGRCITGSFDKNLTFLPGVVYLACRGGRRRTVLQLHLWPSRGRSVFSFSFLTFFYIV